MPNTRRVNRSPRWLAMATLAFSLAAACGGGDGGPTDPDGGGDAGFSARIDGDPWSSGAATLQVVSGSSAIPGSLLITGTRISGNSAVTLQLTLAFMGGPGTARLGVNVGTNSGGIGTIIEQSGTTVETRTTPLNGAAGVVTITSLTATRIAGTFTFVAEPQPGIVLAGNRTITDGEFDVALPSGFTAVPVANRGNRVAASIAGEPWNGATVLGLGAGGAWVLGGTTVTRNLQLSSTTPITTTGSYNLLGGINLRVVDLTNAHTWGGVAGDSGTVEITSLADGRVVGTFGGKLQPGAGTTGTLMVTGGTFDIRVTAP